MASFPTIQPSDSAEIAAYIRWWLQVDEDIISDQDMIDLIDPNITKYPDSLCKTTYYATIDILYWIIRTQAGDIGSSGGSGAVMRRREKRGKTEIEVEYDEGSGSDAGWQKVLDDLLNTPTSIGCDPFSDSTSSVIRAPIIGGADINGYQEGFRSRERFGAAIRESRYSRNRRLF